MKPLLSILFALIVGLLFVSLTGCRGAAVQPSPTGQFIQDAEQVLIAEATDQVSKAINNDKSLSPAEKAAATRALADLPNVISNPSGSAVVQTAWDAAGPILQQYSTSPKAVIGPATYSQIASIVTRYIAALKAAEQTPTTQPSPPTVSPAWYQGPAWTEAMRISVRKYS
jgi:hypothetical protein